MSKLADLAVRTVAGTLNCVPDRVWHWLCESGKGHSYSTSVIQTERDFLLDPTVGCSLCGKPMSDAVYVALTDAYAQILLLETTEEAW